MGVDAGKWAKRKDGTMMWEDGDLAEKLEGVGESFQLQMGFSFPFLCANNLRSSLLNIRARSFLLSCT